VFLQCRVSALLSHPPGLRIPNRRGPVLGVGEELSSAWGQALIVYGLGATAGVVRRRDVGAPGRASRRER
jgi:hypothetical protein